MRARTAVLALWTALAAASPAVFAQSISPLDPPDTSGFCSVLTPLWEFRSVFERWQRMCLDLAYIGTWSLRLDVQILVRTVPVLLTARGAH